MESEATAAKRKHDETENKQLRETRVREPTLKHNRIRTYLDPISVLQFISFELPTHEDKEEKLWTTKRMRKLWQTRAGSRRQYSVSRWCGVFR